MIKVLHVITDLDQGGAEVALLRLLEHSSSDIKHEVLSLVSKGKLRSKFESLSKVSDLGLDYGQMKISALYKLIKFSQTSQWDVIQGWMYHGNIAASCLIKFQLQPSLIHGIRQCLYENQKMSLTSKLVLKLNAYLSKHADICLYNSKESIKHHLEVGFISDNAKLWYNGFNLKELNSDLNKREQLRSKLGLDSKAFLIGSLGRDHPMKDYPTAFEALSKVSMIDENVHFVLGGKELDSNNIRLRQLVSKFDLPSDRIHLIGPVIDTQQFYSAIDCFLLSSMSEAFPNVLAEAMAFRVPVVSTSVGEVSVILGEYPGICNPRDSQQMAACLKQIISLNNKDRTKISATLHNRLRQQFSIQNYIEQIEKIYRNLSCKSA